MPTKLEYKNRILASVSNTPNGQVSSSTIFHYDQNEDGSIVWATYAGGQVVKGFLIATVRRDNGILDARYEHVDDNGALHTGRCVSTPELLYDGRLRLHEKWKWTSGDESEGYSVVEEVKRGHAVEDVQKE